MVKNPRFGAGIRSLAAGGACRLAWRNAKCRPEQPPQLARRTLAAGTESLRGADGRARPSRTLLLCTMTCPVTRPPRLVNG
jgi:hypothetical protein